MKNPKYVIPVSALLAALAVHHWSRPNHADETSTNETFSSASTRQSRGNLDFRELSLASKGLLWEPLAVDHRERAVKTMPLHSDSLNDAMSVAVGSNITLKLSDKIAPISAQISRRDTESDGTVITNLTLDGTPQGHLTIQENRAMDFFLGQLYYENHPVAYEFKKADGQLIAARHELSDLICALLDHQNAEVEQMGLPPVDKVRGKKSDDADKAAIEKAKKSLQEAKPGTGSGGTTALTLSIDDPAITEGNSGSSTLTFTVRLSKSDRKNTISVNYSTSDGTAIAGSDYNASSGTVSIPAGRNSATFTVLVLGDTNIEANEFFYVNLSNPVNAALADAQGMGTITNDDSAPSLVPAFNSLPGAVAVAYLDMDGQVVSGTQWAGGGTITARGVVGTLSNAQMLEVCQRVAEDFSPFQINVTTEESVYLAAPTNRRIRCIITPDNEWYGSAGGVAYLNSFTWTGDTPCWVFSDMLSNHPRYIAEATSHEIGHTLSLRHDGRISPSEAYYQGHGSGEVGWAPIMGVGYYKLLVQWSRGEYLSANNTENDLNSITTLNGFGYRVDQIANTISTATPLTGGSGARSASGIIETVGDLDVFSFSTSGGSCSFSVLGDAISQNTDLTLEILDAAGAVIQSANPDGLTDASISTTLPAGNYFIRISSVGRGDVLADGYSNYGGIGQYTISGSAP